MHVNTLLMKAGKDSGDRIEGKVLSAAQRGEVWVAVMGSAPQDTEKLVSRHKDGLSIPSS